MKPTRLLLLAPSGQPSPWLTISPDGRVLQRGMLEAGDPAPGDPDAFTVVAVPGADVLIRWVEAPGRTEAQAGAAALYALRDALAVPVEQLTLSLGRAEPGETTRLAVVAADTTLGGWIDRVRALGLEPDILCPDVLLLPAPADEEALSSARFGDQLAVRGARFALSGEPELVDLVAAGRPVQPLDGPDRLEEALVLGALSPPVNLCRTRAPAPDPRRWRRTAVLAALALASPILLTVVAVLRDDHAARAMQTEARQLVQKTWPGAPAGDPVEVVRKLAVAPPPGGVAPAAAALFAAVEKVEGAELDSMAFDQGGLQATLSHMAYEDVEALKTDMAAAGLSLTALSTENDGDRIVSEIVIGAGR